MATGAGADYRGVVNFYYRIPGYSGMTTVTGIGGINMGSGFSSSGCAVMAGTAGTGYITMIHRSSGPNIGVVAGVAAGGSCDMRSRFARRRSPVMATGAGADYRGVVNFYYRIPA